MWGFTLVWRAGGTRSQHSLDCIIKFKIGTPGKTRRKKLRKKKGATTNPGCSPPCLDMCNLFRQTWVFFCVTIRHQMCYMSENEKLVQGDKRKRLWMIMSKPIWRQPFVPWIWTMPLLKVDMFASPLGADDATGLEYSYARFPFRPKMVDFTLLELKVRTTKIAAACFLVHSLHWAMWRLFLANHTVHWLSNENNHLTISLVLTMETLPRKIPGKILGPANRMQATSFSAKWAFHQVPLQRRRNCGHMESEGQYSYQKIYRADAKTFRKGVAVISVSNGKVDGITWDTGCFDCASSSCEKNTYTWAKNDWSVCESGRTNLKFGFHVCLNQVCGSER